MASQIYRRTTSPQPQQQQRSVTFQSSVAEVLSKLKLSDHEDEFRLHQIDTYSDLEMLTDEQLREIGVWKVGERNRLRRWIMKNLLHQDMEGQKSSTGRAMMTTITEQPAAEGAAEEATASETSRTSHPPSQIVQAPPGAGSTSRITVSEAGVAQSNGVYEHDGEWDGVRKYSKRGFWKGKEVSFSLFRCVLLNDTKRWYISIVPKEQQPGTSLDTDFYSSPQVQELADLPPQGGWTTCKPNGTDPPPKLDVDVHSIIAYTSASEAAESSTNFGWDDEGSTFSVDSALAVARGKGTESQASSSRTRYERIINIDDAGTDFLCGAYGSDGTHDGVKKYSCSIERGGSPISISLFRSTVKGNRKRWYLAIPAEDRTEGTGLDRNFYSAPIDEAHPERPPEGGWVVDGEGKEPPPRLSYVRSHNDSDNGDDQPLLLPTSNRSSVARRTTVTRSNLSSQAQSSARFHNLQQLRVSKAGVPTINGLYDPAGLFDGVNKYVKHGFWKGRDRMFTLFRCLVKGKKKRWYISICPGSLHPGTVCDVDFYTAPATGSEDELPPKRGWVAVDEGRGRGPTVDQQGIDPTASEAAGLASEGTLKEFPQPSNKDSNKGGHQSWTATSSLFQSDTQRQTVERVTGPIRGPSLVTVNGKNLTERT